MEARWIPVTERMPEFPSTGSVRDNAVHCICAVCNGQVIALEWARNIYAKTERGRTPRWEWNRRISPWEPTHWMTYPKHPDKMTDPLGSPAGQTRRLSIKEREARKDWLLGISSRNMREDSELNALHDLDLADKEIALMDTIYDKNQESLREQASELDAAQAIIKELSDKLEEAVNGWRDENAKLKEKYQKLDNYIAECLT